MSTLKASKPRPVLVLSHVSKNYELDGITIGAVNNVSLTISEGELVAITGPSGSGKSTLMHIMGLLDRQSQGKVTLDNKDVTNLSEAEAAKLRNKYVGFIFQQFNLLTKTSALENVLLPTIYSDNASTSADKQKAMKLLTSLGLSDPGLKSSKS